MEYMNKSLLLAFLAMLTSIVASSFAAGPTPNAATLSWGTPMLHVDGSPITGALTYDAYRGLQGQTRTLLVSGLTGNSYVDSALAPGTWCYDLVAHEAGNPTPSDHSAVDNVTNCKTVLPAAPPAPTGVTVAKATVYSPQPQLNSYKMIAVGTIPINAQVIAGQYVNGLCVVNRSAVKWSGKLRPSVVVTDCG